MTIIIGVSIRRIDTPYCAFRHTFVRFGTPHPIYSPYLCITKYNQERRVLPMDYFDFFLEAPILATTLILVYVVLWVLFIYMLIRMYKKHL